MDTKLKMMIAFIALGVIIMSNGCGKLHFNCTETVHNFQATVTAYPDKDSIGIGDTIWLESNIPAILNDIATKKSIDYSGAANLGVAISVDRFIGGSISDPGTTYAANEFKYILSKGISVEDNIITPERIKAYSFIESGNQYFLKVGIIPIRKGVYILGFGNSQNVYRTSNKCTKAQYFINFENTEQHLYLYQNNRPGYNIEGLELTNNYCFKVY